MRAVPAPLLTEGFSPSATHLSAPRAAPSVQIAAAGFASVLHNAASRAPPDRAGRACRVPFQSVCAGWRVGGSVQIEKADGQVSPLQSKGSGRRALARRGRGARVKVAGACAEARPGPGRGRTEGWNGACSN